MALAACSTDGGSELTSGLPGQVQSASALPVLPNLAALPSMADLTADLTKAAALPVGSPTDVYTRVARGALTCWFGASGPLKGPYIYHADAEPPSKGGRAEIVIRARDRMAADPRSLKAFSVAIEPGGEGTKLTIENAKIPEPLATRLTADVRRWAADDEGCGEAPVTAGWTAAPAAPSAPKAGNKSQPKKTGTATVATKP